MNKLASIIILTMVLAAQSLCAYETVYGEDAVSKLTPVKEGPIKILSLALYPAHYDSIELANRVESEIATIRLGQAARYKDFERRTFYWHELQVKRDEMATDILKALEDTYDIIIIAFHKISPAWDAYPEDVRNAIIDKVKSGTALLTYEAGTGLLEALKQDNTSLEELELAVNKFPAIKEKPSLTKRYYRFGKGKVAVLQHQIDNRRGYLTSQSYNQLHYEYKFRRIANIIYKFSKNIKESAIEIAQVNDAAKCLLKLNGSEKPRTVSYTLRDADYESLETQTATIKPHTRTVEFAIPRLPNGEYTVEAVVFEDDKVADWVSVVFNVDYNAKIASAALNKEIFSEREQLNLALSYSGKTQQPLLLLKFEDAHGRCYYENKYKTLPEKIEMEVPGGSLSVLNFIKLYLYDGSRLLDIKTVKFTQPDKVAQKDFHVLLWGFGGDSIRSRRYMETLYNYGISGSCNCYRSEQHARSLAYHNMQGVPYTTRLHRVMLDKNIFDDQWIDSMKQRCVSTANAYSKYAALGYTLGDENYVSAFEEEGRFSNSPKVTKYFREYLKKDYEDISELNTQWETSYASFDEIQLTTEKDLFVSDTNPSPWVDYRRFITDEFMNLHYRFRDLIKSIDPKAKVGWDGGTQQWGSYDGHDWYKFTSGLNVNGIYLNYMIKGGLPNLMFNGLCMRSFTDKDNLRGGFMNMVDGTWGMRYVPWYAALCQFNSIWWWYGSFLGSEVDPFDITLEPSSIFARMLETSKEIQQGAATLLQRASFEFDPIAIHYSGNNWHASTLSSGIGHDLHNLGTVVEDWFKKPMCADNKDLLMYGEKNKGIIELFGDIEAVGHYAPASKNFIMLFHDLGYQPRMMARQEIEAGRLLKDGYKVLVLPFVESLSKEEVGQIYEFVKNGGFLIADYRTGIRDKHGKFYKKSPLDELLGIHRSSFDVKKKFNRIFINVFKEWDYDAFGEFQGLFFSPHVEITSDNARNLGHNDEGVPMFIINKYGKGHTLFLNTDLYSYFNARRKGTERDYQNMFRNCLWDYVPLKPNYEVLMDGQPAQQTEIFHYTDHGIEYIGIIRDFGVWDKSDFDVLVPLHTKSYVYSVRDGRYFGYTDVVESELKSGDTLLLAKCPYKIEGVKITGSKAVKRGGHIILDIEVMSGDVKELLNHVVHVEVCGPNNENKLYLNKNLYLKNGKGQYAFPIALNDSKGAWRIEVTEIISSQKAIKKVSIK